MGLFNTTANTQFNSFQDPFNSMNMNQGAWGMNSNYLTPSFDAPYRPPYMGFAGTGVTHPNPGFGRSVYGISPFNGGTPYGVNAYQQDEIYRDKFSSSIPDAFMSMNQRFTVPLLAFAGANAFANKFQMANLSSAMRKTMYNAHFAFGGSSSAASAYASTVNVFGNMGQRLGGGLMEGLAGGLGMNSSMGGAGGSIARGMAGTGRFIGGVAGASLGFTGLAQAGIEATDRFVFEPYNGIRENQNLIRQMYKNQAFAGGDGDSYTGGGVNRRSAARMGTRLTQMGSKDQLFNAREIASLTDMAGQMGMLDNIPSDQLVSRMGSLVKQIKLVMNIAGTTDFKEAMNTMAKLNMAGVPTSNISNVMARLGGYAGAAGISTQRLMDTVGAQGQYLYQANGLTPYLGQLAGGQAIAGLAAGRRSGLISDQMISRLGGVEGATQSAVSGQLAGLQTPYNAIRAFNTYTLGQRPQGVVANVTAFGNAMSKDPVTTAGNFLLNRGANLSRQVSEFGALGSLDSQVSDFAQHIGMAGKDGKVSAQAAALAMQTMGMNESEIQANMYKLAAIQDPKTRAQMIAGIGAKKMETIISQREQAGETPFSAFVSPFTKGVRSLTAKSAGAIGLGVEGAGGVTDWFSAVTKRFNYGSESDSATMTVSDLNAKGGQDVRLLQEPSFKDNLRMFRSEVGSAFRPGQNALLHPYMFQRINELAKSGNKNALAVLQSQDKSTVKNNLYALQARVGISDLDSATDAILGASRQSGQGNFGDVGFNEFHNRLKGIAEKDFDGPGGGSWWSAGGRQGNVLFPRNASELTIVEGTEAAHRLVRAFEASGDDPTGLLEDPKVQADINTLLSTTGKSINKTDLPAIHNLARQISKTGSDSGVAFLNKTNDLVRSAGGGAEVMKKAEAGSLFTKDSKFGEKFKTARTAGEKQTLALRGLAEASNATILRPKVAHPNANQTAEQALTAQEGIASLGDTAANLEKMAREGKIDAKSWVSAQSALDLKETSMRFAEAVDEFVKGVSKNNGGSTSSGFSMARDIFGLPTLRSNSR